MCATSRRLIGLTGGISTGKTTVSHYLADIYKLPVLDADIYAREAVQTNSPILVDIFNRYGKSIQLLDGTLDRKQLGEIIFNNPEEKSWLEAKIHPYVCHRFQSELQLLNQQTIILVIPLLFEANLTNLVTEIWVVYCSEEEQIKRLTERDRLNKQQAIARINSQLSLQTKASLADFVLDNSSTLEYLFRQVDDGLNKGLGTRD